MGAAFHTVLTSLPRFFKPKQLAAEVVTLKASQRGTPVTRCAYGTVYRDLNVAKFTSLISENYPRTHRDVAELCFTITKCFCFFSV